MRRSREVRVDRAQAIARTKAELDAHKDRLANTNCQVREQMTTELWWAWIVPFGGVNGETMFGCGPMLVDKHSGEVIWTGSRFVPIVRRIERERGLRAWWRFWGPTIVWPEAPKARVV